MKFFKKVLITLVTTFALLSLIFALRISIILPLSDHLLAQYNIKITCLDFTITPSFSLDIASLCLSTDEADITVKNAMLHWQLLPQFRVNHVEVNQVEINTHKAFLKRLTGDKKGEIKNNQATPIAVISDYARLLQQLEIPFPINIKQFYYQPYAPSKLASNYNGNLSLSKNQLKFAAFNDQQEPLTSIKIQTSVDKISAEINSNLALLAELLVVHQIPFPNELKITGQFSSQLTWQAKQLTLNNQIQELFIDTESGFSTVKSAPTTGPLEISANLNWQTTLQAQSLKNTFEDDAKLSISFSPAHVKKILAHYKQPEPLVNFLNNNPINNLTISSLKKFDINLAQQVINMSKASFTFSDQQAISGQQPLVELNTNNILVNFNSSNQLDNKTLPNQLSFTLKSTTKHKELNAITQSPLMLYAEGNIIHKLGETVLNIAPQSTISIKKVFLNQVDKSNQHPKVLVHSSEIKSEVSGSLRIKAPNVFPKLQVNTIIKQLEIPHLAQIHKLLIHSQIAGNLNNVNFSSEVFADEVPLTKLNINGDIKAPNVQVSANQLPLTKLLALNIKLPVEINLAEGFLSYQLSSQVTNFTNIFANDATISWQLNDVSGDFDGTWLESLTWQQHVNYAKTKLATDNRYDNFIQIKKIETATTIENIRTDLDINYQQQLTAKASSLSAQLLGGKVDIEQLTWPLTEHSVKVQLDNIDLEKVLELDPKQGIVVTGKVSGELPLHIIDNSLTITGGKLHNISNGIIRITENPAVNELKTQNSQLKLAFDALENLHYHQLQSDVSMANDGYMQLDTVIKGRNPDLDNDVNLNLNLSYDLMGLLESLSITAQFEKNILDSLQKP